MYVQSERNWFLNTEKLEYQANLKYPFCYSHVCLMYPLQITELSKILEWRSGWWAVYNAIMFVLTGSDEFTKAFTERQRVPQLRERFPELTMTENMGFLLTNQSDLLEQLSLDLRELFNPDRMTLLS